MQLKYFEGSLRLGSQIFIYFNSKRLHLVGSWGKADHIFHCNANFSHILVCYDLHDSLWSEFVHEDQDMILLFLGGYQHYNKWRGCTILDQWWWITKIGCPERSDPYWRLMRSKRSHLPQCAAIYAKSWGYPTYKGKSKFQYIYLLHPLVLSKGRGTNRSFRTVLQFK